jgi:hypothetical protein
MPSEHGTITIRLVAMSDEHVPPPASAWPKAESGLQSEMHVAT